MQNKKLALATGKIGWHKFKTMLEYKADWYGKNIQYIGRFTPSSTLCSDCGTIFKELSLKDSLGLVFGVALITKEMRMWHKT